MKPVSAGSDVQPSPNLRTSTDSYDVSLASHGYTLRLTSYPDPSRCKQEVAQKSDVLPPV